MSSTLVKVLLLHAEAVVAAGLIVTLNRLETVELVAEAGSGTPLVIADYERGLARAMATSSQLSEKVLVVSDRNSEVEVCHALACGVRGYLTLGCSAAELSAAIKAVQDGRRYLDAGVAPVVAGQTYYTPLTLREADVLRLVGKGMGNKGISQRLEICVATVKAHVSAICQKLGANNRTTAAVIALRRGIVKIKLPSPPSPP